MQHDDRADTYERLKQACSLSTPAHALREEYRHRLKAAHPTPYAKQAKEESVEQAWAKMWVVFKPVVERIEKLKEELKQAKERPIVKEPEATFQGYTGELDDIVDPNYRETDAGKRLRDAFVWVGDAFRRITTDFPDGSTVMDFSKATSPPPTVLAVQIAEEYAQSPPGSRRELFSKLTSFAVKSHTPKDASETVDTSEADAHLAALEEEPCSGPKTT